MSSLASCIFCKIIKGIENPISTDSRAFTLSALTYSSPASPLTNKQPGDIPSFKLYESEKVFAFLDINPLSKGHALVIPKHHGEKITDIPDDILSEILVCLLPLGADELPCLEGDIRKEQ
jgi:diadenosine tetraphosphate (Ap4A) HIT family hydrolase